ncbi:MAG TPA: FG-GAP-like repeat-containing protein [Acidobacteriota bacterium]|nr:FG-GAP-like repeat-containing protein [Acidobacteriota bacterium]
MQLWLLLAIGLLSADTALERGQEAFRRRDFTTAEKEFLQAIREEPSNARAHKFLGMVYTAEERFQRAEEPFRQACAIDPKEENACYYLGRVYYTLNRYEDSLAAFDKALQNASEKGRTFYGMALTLEAMGRDAEAEQDFKESIRAGEKSALQAYGMFLFRHGRTEESLAALRNAGAKEELERVTNSLGKSPGTKARREPQPLRFESRPLDMIVNNGATGRKYLVETMIAGIAIFDYDNDGWPDIFIANGASLPGLEKTDAGFSNRLFHNNRDGTFEDVTAKAGIAGRGYSMGVAAADYDNDGWVDLFVTGVRSNALYRNRGDGTFEDVTARAGVGGDGSWAVAAAWLDYDNDGWLDLFVVRYLVWDPAHELNCGVQRPGMRGYCHPQHFQPLPNALYHNQRNGTFRDVSIESGIAQYRGKGMGVAIGDYDLDGRMDIFVANDTVPNFLFHNEGSGKFREVGVPAWIAYNGDARALSSMGADFRDYDNDGREDIFVTALSNETFPLFRNLPEGGFIDLSIPSRIAAGSVPWSGWSTGIFDFNNDGLKDIFTANGNVIDNAEMISSRKSRQPNTVFTNRGDGTFRMETLPGAAFHRGAAFGDLDRDGRIDVAVTRLNENPVVLRNITDQSGHWIQLRLVGTKSNRDGIGAWIHIVTESGDQWNRVTTSVGYGSSSDRVVHFGLGNESVIKTISIDWPSGIRQRLENVQADRFLTIEER